MRKPAGPNLPEPTFRTKSYLLIGLVLLVPILPFALFGWWLEPLAEKWTLSANSSTAISGLVIGLLASDILLPIPSSVISTIAGNQLGSWLGMTCSWIGMTASAIIGFALARSLGSRFMKDEQAKFEDHAWNATSLVLFRGLPVLAEASVLYSGLRGRRWKHFLPPIMLSNLGISAGYAWLGETVTSTPALVLLLSTVAAAPLVISLFVRRKQASSKSS